MSHGHMTESLQTTNGQNLHDSYTCMQYIVVQNVHKCTQTPIANAVTMICIPMRKDYTFRRQFNEKPSIIPGCPGCAAASLLAIAAEPARIIATLIANQDERCCCALANQNDAFG